MSESLTDKLAAFFQAQPLTWIDGKELALHGGGYGWRTRVSDLRKRGMTIENKVTRVLSSHVKAPYAVSEYRYVPAEAPQPATVTGHDLNAFQPDTERGKLW